MKLSQTRVAVAVYTIHCLLDREGGKPRTTQTLRKKNHTEKKILVFRPTVNKLRKRCAPFWRSRAKNPGCMGEQPLAPHGLIADLNLLTVFSSVFSVGSVVKSPC
jgi:hypothetical protein